MNIKRLVLLAAVVVLIALFFALDLQRFLSVEYLGAQGGAIVAFKDDNTWAAAAMFFVAYVAVTGLSLPGAALMTLIAGALFGLGRICHLICPVSSVRVSGAQQWPARNRFRNESCQAGITRMYRGRIAP